MPDMWQKLVLTCRIRSHRFDSARFDEADAVIEQLQSRILGTIFTPEQGIPLFREYDRAIYALGVGNYQLAHQAATNGLSYFDEFEDDKLAKALISRTKVRAARCST